MAGITAGTCALFAFTANSEANEEMKRYEVIRTKDGETQMFDTLISMNSSYTPAQYLEDLGFADDAEIEIVDLTSLPSKGSEIKVIELNSDENEWIDEEGKTEFFVKKECTVDGKEIEVDGLNMDSLVNTFVYELVDSIESSKIEKHMIFIDIEEGVEGREERVDVHGSEPSFHFIEEDGNTTKEIKVFGDEKDMTLVLVTNADMHSGMRTHQKNNFIHDSNDENLEIYPNPSNELINLKYDFSEEAKTTITVNDASGKEVLSLERGNESGEQLVDINTASLPAGIYFVNVLHGESKMVSKIVIE